VALQLEWQRGPISGRLILYVDGALWPRAEVFQTATGEFEAVLFHAAHGDDTVVGRFHLLVQAQAVAERALIRSVTESFPSPQAV
jgi:hypothetical protein